MGPEPRQPETCAMFSDAMLCCCSLHRPLIWPGPAASVISPHTSNCHHQPCPFSGKHGTRVCRPRLHWCRLHLCVSTFKPCATVPIWVPADANHLLTASRMLSMPLESTELVLLSHFKEQFTFHVLPSGVGTIIFVKNPCLV